MHQLCWLVWPPKEVMQIYVYIYSSSQCAFFISHQKPANQRKILHILKIQDIYIYTYIYREIPNSVGWNHPNFYTCCYNHESSDWVATCTNDQILGYYLSASPQPVSTRRATFLAGDPCQPSRATIGKHIQINIWNYIYHHISPISPSQPNFAHW